MTFANLPYFLLVVLAFATLILKVIEISRSK